MKWVWSIAFALALLGGTVWSSVAQAETLTAGNGIYSVYVNSETGQYTVTTGPSHPLGPGLNVLFGNGSPGTSFDTVRSYSSGPTNYELRNIASQTTVPLGTTGFRTTFTLSTGGGANDDLSIVQDLQVSGTTFIDSHVDVTTIVTNTGTTPRQIGVRYLWDYQIARDDGPTFQANEPNGPVLLTEEAFPQPSFDQYTIRDNDVNPSPPTFDVLGAVDGPASANPVPPTLLQNASWAAAVGTAFDYTTTPGQVVSVASETNDNAVLYYWGDSSADAPTIGPGGSYRASASMFLTPPGEGLPHPHVPPPPPPIPAPSPPAVTITSGPPHESAQTKAKFTFVGVPGGSYECSIDGGPWRPCTSPHAYGSLQPGDHLFQVRETLPGATGPVAGYRWTMDLPKACVLRVARARVFVYAEKQIVRLVIHYTSYRAAEVTVSYEVLGKQGKLELGSASALFKKAGVFRLPEELQKSAAISVRAGKLFKVHFKIPETPHSCGRYFTKELTIPQTTAGQKVWLQSDSKFAP
jgi:hypothetical protein